MKSSWKRESKRGIHYLYRGLILMLFKSKEWGLFIAVHYFCPTKRAIYLTHVLKYFIEDLQSDWTSANKLYGVESKDVTISFANPVHVLVLWRKLSLYLMKQVQSCLKLPVEPWWCLSNHELFCPIIFSQSSPCENTCHLLSVKK